MHLLGIELVEQLADLASPSLRSNAALNSLGATKTIFCQMAFRVNKTNELGWLSFGSRFGNPSNIRKRCCNRRRSSKPMFKVVQFRKPCSMISRCGSLSAFSLWQSDAFALVAFQSKMCSPRLADKCSKK